MAHAYRVTGHRPVLDHEPGSEFEHDFTAIEEAEHVAAGRLEIVPQTYKVVGHKTVFGTEPGKEFTVAMTATQEAQLVEGGHIKRAAPKPAPRKPKEE